MEGNGKNDKDIINTIVAAIHVMLIITSFMPLFLFSSLSFIKFIIFSSALPGYSSCVKFSTDNSSFTLISSILHKGIILDISGSPFPHSHFDMYYL